MFQSSHSELKQKPDCKHMSYQKVINRKNVVKVEKTGILAEFQTERPF